VKTTEYLRLFNEISDDDRRAFCEGDLSIEDIAPYEMSTATRERLKHHLRQWWKNEA
jgi:hypothetical protein